MAKVLHKELKKSKLYLRVYMQAQADKRAVFVTLTFSKSKGDKEGLVKYNLRFRPVTGYYSYMWQCSRHVKHETAQQYFSGKKGMTKALMTHIKLALKDYVH